MSPMRELLPQDEYNKALLANVHPSDWVNPRPASCYNLVVIGAGTAGLVAAAGAAGLGAKVALVERHFLGGDCLNDGCVPSKSLIRAAHVATEVRCADYYGIRGTTAAEVDFAAAMSRMRQIRAEISEHDSVRRFQALGVDVFLGEAHFSGPRTVEVEGRVLRFQKAVVATGSRPVVPPIEGLADAGFLTNETIFSLTERPRHLAVIGGGPIGAELAQAFKRLGSEVSLIERSNQILGRDNPEAAKLVAEAFRREGIEVLLQCEVRKVLKSGDRKRMILERDSNEQTLETDAILVSTGRSANVEGLDLEKAGVKYDRGGVVVNDYLQTTNPRIYAAGDVCLPYKFTHTADASARIVIQNALFFGRKKLSSLIIPWCTFTEPEMAHVGLTSHEAAARGIAIDTVKVALTDVDRAVVDGDENGFVVVYLKQGTDRILGATIVSRNAGEMISEVSVAMACDLGLKSLAKVIHPYPTKAEAIRKVADAYNRTRLTPTIKGLLARWLAWRR